MQVKLGEGLLLKKIISENKKKLHTFFKSHSHIIKLNRVIFLQQILIYNKTVAMFL